MDYKKLRKKYPLFVYNNYSYKVSNNNLEIFFDFKIEPNIFFKPKIIIPGIKKINIKKEVLDNLIFHLGLIELISYWKATCAPIIEIRAGSLGKEQMQWWKDLIFNGMGQFFYENKINWKIHRFLKIIPKKTKFSFSGVFKGKLKDQSLLPVGGGKDSIVTLEILKKARKNILCFSLNPTKNTNAVMKIAGCKKIIAKRKIDPKLLELNRKGFLNGHTPFSAYLAFLSVLVSVILNKKYAAFSNEKSSNEGNLIYLHEEINHQYSKSFDFEKKFRKYSKKYLAQDIEYFSFLRPLYEIQIARLFSKYPKYFNAFLSCNEAYKTYSGTKKQTGKWCCACSKCLFVFACLYPFLNEKELIKIFKQNLFKKRKLLSLMKELIGEKRFKPFECVGTKKESLIAFYLSWKKAKKQKNLPFLLKYFENNILSKYPGLEKESEKILGSWDNRHNLSRDLVKIISQA